MKQTTLTTHPLTDSDVMYMNALRGQVGPFKGTMRGAAARETFDGIAERVSPVEGVEFSEGASGSVPGWWTAVDGATPDAVILYVHGGWFNWGSAKAYRMMVGHISAVTRINAFIPDYRLAPEHPFPAAPLDVRSVYETLSAAGYKKIVLVGDSAGGNLVLGLSTSLTQNLPSGIVALSPVTDLTLGGESMTTRAEAEPYFVKDQIQELVGAYLAGADPMNPLASPLFADLSGLPPIRIHVGEDEVLLDDSIRFAERAEKAGTDVRIDVWQGAPHGFQFGVGALNAADSALEAIGQFIRSL
jgi:monoterpene epsilon-lactone hydrolase